MPSLCERKIDLSVIVPVYNLEHFIAPLLESLKEQRTTYNVEYIFVLNNCTDNSEQVIRDSSLGCTIINCTEQGCGPARNAGLDIAQGEYIWMMDGDDWLISNTAIQDALDLCRGLDIIHVPFRSDKFRGDYFSMVWQYIIRRDFIGDIRFLAIQPGEDDAFMLQILAKKNLNEYTYHWLPSLAAPVYFYNYLRTGSNMYRFIVLKEKI